MCTVLELKHNTPHSVLHHFLPTTHYSSNVFSHQFLYIWITFKDPFCYTFTAMLIKSYQVESVLSCNEFHFHCILFWFQTYIDPVLMSPDEHAHWQSSCTFKAVVSNRVRYQEAWHTASQRQACLAEHDLLQITAINTFWTWVLPCTRETK